MWHRHLLWRELQLVVQLLPLWTRLEKLSSNGSTTMARMRGHTDARWLIASPRSSPGSSASETPSRTRRLVKTQLRRPHTGPSSLSSSTVEAEALHTARRCAERKPQSCATREQAAAFSLLRFVGASPDRLLKRTRTCHPSALEL